MKNNTGEAVAAVTRLPIERVQPDPLQPRKNVDSDLAESIKHNGQQVPITVWPTPHGDDRHKAGNFTILNGERRYRAHIAAGLTDIDVIIVPEPSKAERMMKQVISNQGKALTPIEEAFAFRQIMTDAKISQNELAKRLGIPRSTVGDRIRLIELAPYWLDLIKEEKLQVAHAAILHRYREVPEPYQEKAYERAMDPQRSYRIGGRIKNGELVQVKDFEHELFPCFLPHLKATFRVPGYTGPTITTSERSPADWSNQCPKDWKGEYACDPKEWGKIFRAAQKEAKKNDPTAGSQRQVYDSRPQHQKIVEATAKALKLTVRKEYKLEEGEKIVWGNDGWMERDGIGWEHRENRTPLDGGLFMEKTDKAKLVAIVSGYNSCLVSSDTEAMVQAANSFRGKKTQLVSATIADLTRQFDTLDGFDVFGPGSIEILQLAEQLQNGKWARSMLAVAVGTDLGAIFVQKAVPWSWECLFCRCEAVAEDEDGNEVTVVSEDDSRVCSECYDGDDEDWALRCEDAEAERKEEPMPVVTAVADDVNMEEVERLAKAMLAWMRGSLKVPTENQLVAQVTEECSTRRDDDVTVEDEDPAESGGEDEEETSDEEMQERFGDAEDYDDDEERREQLREEYAASGWAEAEAKGGI